MDDYTTDKRGDIGSMVRESSMNSMSNILKLISNNDFLKKLLKSNVLQGSITLILQQLVEKIDRTRLIAGSIM
jgi:hypothetical protein